MNIRYSTQWNTSHILKILFIGVHHNCCRDDFLKSLSGTEIALKFDCHSLGSILLYSFDHKRKELVPLILWQLISCLHGQFLLSFMAHKCRPKLLSIIIHIFGEVQHNRQPHIIRSNLHISVPVVCLHESVKKAVIESRPICWSACLLIS